ncbi:hypothetical protein JXB22_07305 [candidate division WOR-3 bacterium]|nr:hypothetical protein [candidate division WOR-3 bacterium]
MSSIDRIKNFVYCYARRQQRIEIAAVALFTLGMVLLCVSVSLVLLKSPVYGLLGVIPLLFYRRQPLIDRARHLEQHLGLRGEVVNSIQLSGIRSDSKERYSQELINAYIDRADEVCATRDPSQAVHTRSLHRALRILSICLILGLLYPVLAPARFWYALFQRIEYRVMPAAGPYMRGEKTSLGIQFFGVYVPSTVTVTFHDQDSTTRTTIRVKDDTASLSRSAGSPFSYRFSFFRQTTPEYTVNVIDPLSIRSLVFELHYPPYTGLVDEAKTGRHILAPQGTNVTLRGIASDDLSAAFLYASDTQDLDRSGRQFTGSFPVRTNETMTLHLCSQSILDETIMIYAIPDMPPLVDVFYPGHDVMIPQSMELMIGIQCSDDYGLNHMRFIYAFQETISIPLPVRRDALEDTLTYAWDLTTLHILPGDEITYYVEVVDNAGKGSRSALYRVYFPTMEEIYKEVGRTEENITEDIKAAHSQHAQEIESLNRLHETLKKERQLSWPDQQQLKELLAHEEQLLEKIDEWQEELTRTIEQLEQGIVLDQQAIERLQEISRILEEIAPDELKQALTQYEKMAEDPQRMQAMVEQLQEHKEELAKALERTLELLNRYQQELALQELAEMAEELAQRAGELDSLTREGLNQDMEARTDELKKDMERFAQMLDELAQSRGLEQELSEALKQYAQQTRSMLSEMSAPPGAHQQSLQQMSASLQQWYEKLTAGRAAQIREKLLGMLDELIEISKAEERLSERGGPIDIEQQHQILNATRVAAESLYAQRSTSMYITSRMAKNMARALVNMEQAIHAEPALHQQYAGESMRLINLVALEILENLEQATQGDGSSTGLDQFLQQLANISQGQMMLNQSLFNLFPIPHTGLSPQQQTQLSKLAEKQQALREALEGLQQKYGGTEYQPLMDQIAQDMQEAEDALFQHKLDRELIERQQKILTRLLDAQKSIRTEDYGKKRTSTPGADVTIPDRPRPLSGDLGKDELRLMLQRALRNPLPEEYEIYIREYFKRLIEER